MERVAFSINIRVTQYASHLEVGTEQGQFTMAGEQVAIDQRVTNIYRRENGTWKIVHHHADLSPAMLEILSRLQAKA